MTKWEIAYWENDTIREDWLSAQDYGFDLGEDNEDYFEYSSRNI